MRVQPSNKLPFVGFTAPKKVSAAITKSANAASCSCCAGESENPGGGALREEAPRGLRGVLDEGELPCATLVSGLGFVLARALRAFRDADANNRILFPNAVQINRQKKRTRRPLNCSILQR